MTLFEGLKASKLRPLPQEAAIQVDFTGGLHREGSSTELAPNELRSAVNVDIKREGGLARRRAFWPMVATDDYTATAWPFKAEYRTATDVRYYSYGATDGVDYWELVMTPRASWGATTGDYHGITVNKKVGWTASIGGGGSVFPFTSASFQVGSVMYITHGHAAWRSWDGTTLAAVGTTLRTNSENYNGTGLPDFASFSKGGIPIGKTACVWDSRVWVGNTTVSGPSSLYFSFSFGTAQDEGPLDFYDKWVYNFNPASTNDQIVALVPSGGRLFVFMHGKIMVITPHAGEPVEIFYQVQEFQSNVGLIGKFAVTEHNGSIWFVDQHQGLMQITPDGQLLGHSEKVKDYFRDLQHLPGVGIGNPYPIIAVAVVKDRVWVTIPRPKSTNTDNYPRQTLVYDPAIEAWTYYNIGFLAGFIQHRPHALGSSYPEMTMGFVHQKASGSHISAVVALDYAEEYHNTDYFGRPALSPGTQYEVREDITSSFATAWFDGDLTESYKTWRASEFLFRSHRNATLDSQSMKASLYLDWDSHDLGDTWTFDTTSPRVGAYSSGVLPANPVPDVYVESDVLNPAKVERAYFTDETPPVDELSPEFNDPVPVPIRVTSRCSSRSMSLVFEAQDSVQWALDRITLFFKRRPVRT